VAGFLFNIGQDLYNAGKEVIPSLPFPIIIPTVLGLIGLGIILYDLWGRRKQHKTEPEQLHKNLRIKKESPTPTQKIVTRSKKKTDDEKLLDLIQKIDLFIKKMAEKFSFQSLL
jgi:hypothetical protein